MELRARLHDIKKNYIVMIGIISEASTGESRKLFAEFRGPFRVCKTFFNDRYEIENLREGGRGAKTIVVVDREKGFGDRDRPFHNKTDVYGALSP
ncbi:uncharacterized protein LOC113463968 isoform X1 [Ceratina calcarata]|uniref:Uncharacterized protein LOC113463968 isoform X1 n=1 Tax=Ceratina calcarata TaxID=156304 RepID=A0AAJ7W8I4_9HYME|nr:uncharacterized protein LOC113463968 isoform X1 [Ceratina calcarata]